MDQERLSMIVFSGEMDKLLPVGILASGAIAMGHEVRIFLTFWGLMAFKKDAFFDMPVSPSFAGMVGDLGATLKEKRIPGLIEQLRTAKELGDVEVVACGMTMDLFGLKLEDLEDVVDRVDGVGEFIETAKEGHTTLFI
jgi:peroxiredoxin family protein